MRHQIALSLVVAACAPAARADLVDMYLTGTGRGVDVRITMGSRHADTFAGQLLHQADSATGEGGVLLGVNAYYCTDLFEYAATTPTTFTITGLDEVPDSAPMSGATARAVESLFAFADGRKFESGASSAFAGAFQLALWEVISDYDPGHGRSSLDVSEGWFTATGRKHKPLAPDVRAHLGELLDAADAGESFAGSILALRSDGYQDQLYAIPEDPSIPAPASAAALGCGLLLRPGRRRRATGP